MEDQSELKLWEMGLPSAEDLMPTTQTLIPPELALAFGLTADTFRVNSDLNRAMHDNYSTNFPREENFNSLHLSMFPRRYDIDNSTRLKSGDYFGPDEVNSGPKDENGDEIEHNRAVKRPRLVWTPELHQRFVEVIERLGIDKAVPKTIMEMMNVDGLTRENVASHLQKYRLYLKRMEGGSSEGHSSARRDSSVFDTEGFGSLAMPVSHPQPPQQQALHRSSVPLMPMPMPMVPPPGPYGYGHLGLPVASAPPGYCGLESGAYSMFWNRQRG